ncbi:twin-arginine translocase TatA/TatE family subunit [Paenibacillus puerhi]|uniref:twin-arginine translocase TatA/TatE family subunit n=1 Tax=Paenibacillus puerhi TaxID=2692622 RepID=UPI00135A9B0F|nr:twin-arginine translocase TatA/TatE family subunit [Paenibacillus puerhi]
MLGNIGTSEFILIAVVALIVFGPAKLPEIGRTLGKTIREFKQGARELLNDEPSRPERKDVTPESRPAPAPAGEQSAALASESKAAPPVPDPDVSGGKGPEETQLVPDGAVNAESADQAAGEAPSLASVPGPDPVGGLVAPLPDLGTPGAGGTGEAGKASRSNPRRLPD